jgi:hypothetical protein
MTYYLPLCYGISISIIYAVFKKLGVNGGLDLFLINSVIISFIFLILLKFNLKTLLKKTNIIRSILFALTQTSIFLGLKFGYVNEVTVISFVGMIFCTISESMYFSLKNILVFILTLIFLSFKYTNSNIDVFLFSSMAGLLSSLTMIYTRKSNIQKLSSTEALFTNFTFCTLIIPLFYNFDFITFDVSNINILNVMITTFVVLAMQLFYFKMFKDSGSKFVSSLLMIRIPAAYAIDILLFDQKFSSFSFYECVSVLLIAALNLDLFNFFSKNKV